MNNSSSIKKSIHIQWSFILSMRMRCAEISFWSSFKIQIHLCSMLYDPSMDRSIAPKWLSKVHDRPLRGRVRTCTNDVQMINAKWWMMQIHECDVFWDVRSKKTAVFSDGNGSRNGSQNLDTPKNYRYQNVKIDIKIAVFSDGRLFKLILSYDRNRKDNTII